MISGIFFRRIMRDDGVSEAGKWNKIGHMLIIAQLGDGHEEIHSTILSIFMYILKLPSYIVKMFIFKNVCWMNDTRRHISTQYKIDIF